MIYLIGVEHNKTQYEYQDGSNKDFLALFTNFIRKQIAELNIAIIAEELNIESLEQQNVTESTAQKVAEEFCIKHIFCDPSTKERKNLGIPSEIEIAEKLFPKTPYWQISSDSREQQIINKELHKFFPKRERFWLGRIKNLREEIILFICGKSHVVSFKKLLEKHGFKVVILSY